MAIASVLVVEDDTFSRTLLVNALVSFSFEIAGSTGSASKALEIAKQIQMDVALLDLDLGPGPTGLELAVVLRRLWPRVGIVFLTSYRDPRLITGGDKVLPLGSRLVNKSELTNESLLFQVIMGAKSEPLALQPFRETQNNLLTEHQLQVLRMVAQGTATREIAAKTGVSEKAVEASISRVRKILGLHDKSKVNPRVSLVRAFYELTGKSPPRA
jgi:DNA-binding NarL/FixJ family response regulator